MPSANSQMEHERIRPIFRLAIEQWNDVSVTVEHLNVVDIRRASPTMPSENIALLVVGKNRLDARLFERCAAYNIGQFLENGWSIKLLDLDFTAEPPTAEPQRNSAPAAVVAKLLSETKGLRYVVIYTHSRQAINLSDSEDELVVDQPGNGSTSCPGVSICHLRLSEGAAKDGWVDVFGCLCRPNARWPRELAKALNWPVRTVYPGYGINFPAIDHYPKSAIPFTRRFSRSRFGWAVWFPGSERPVRVSEPGVTAQLADNRYGFLERFLVALLSVGLERLRDFRKRRLLAARARKSLADPLLRSRTRR